MNQGEEKQVFIVLAICAGGLFGLGAVLGYAIAVTKMFCNMI